jgi:hypothetical protein
LVSHIKGRVRVRVFESRVLNIIRQIKSRRMRWAGHVACMGEEKKCTRFGWERPKERDHLKDQDIDRRMRSEWISGRFAGEVEWIQLA